MLWSNLGNYIDAYVARATANTDTSQIERAFKIMLHLDNVKQKSMKSW